MLPAYHTVFQSGVSHFFVGKNRKQFAIYKALEPSFPTKALEPAMMEEVDEEVFGRCCEFVYRGDYTAPPPILESFGNNGSPPKDMELQSQKDAKIWNPSHLTCNIFFPKVLPHDYNLSKSENDLSNGRYTNYAEVFLSHAEIHQFGVKTGWNSLSTLSFRRLYRDLENFKLHEERTADIVKLLKYVFEGQVCVKSLQRLLIHYITWNVDMMMRNVDFKEFLERNPWLEHTVFQSMWE
ncbi:hypothetical protein N7540_010958 [Penicillium herquei]|nr:hypothetical protein N7540_010958 [Penicillium herquei]